MDSFRLLRTALPALILTAVLPSCSPRQSKVESGDRSQILYWGNMIEPADLDPQIVSDTQSQNLVMALFEGLTQYDPKTSQPIPAVAERWEVSSDNLRWTFHLRNQARWSDGEPVTARDFVFAYRRILSPAFGAEYAYLLYALKNGESYNAGKISDPTEIGAQAPDDHTLVLNLSHPVPYLPAMICHPSWYPLAQRTIERFGRVDERGTRWTRPGNLVGNGYFVLKEWKPHRYIRVARSPTYWNRREVKLQEVFFYPIDDADAEERAFRSGQLHVTATLPLAKIAVYRQEHPTPLQAEPYLGTYVYRFNVTRPPLDDSRVRRALAMAIDRERIVRDVARGGQRPAGHFTPPGMAGFTARADLPTDIDAARRLLAAAGFPGGRGFPPLSILINTNEGHRQIAEAIQQMWRKNLGINIGIYNQEGKVWNDSMRRLDYSIARFAWVGDYLDPSTFLDIMASDSGNNQTGWKNAEYDRLLDRARQTADTSRRYAYYQRCEEILARECPFAPIYYYVRLYLRRPEVKGWYGNLLDFHPLIGVYLDAAAK